MCLSELCGCVSDTINKEEQCHMFRIKRPEDPVTPSSTGTKTLVRWRWKIVALLVCLAVIAAAAVFIRMKSQAASTDTEYVETTPEYRSVINVFSESGTIEAADTYEVKALVRGEVMTSDFDEGDTVEEGTVLYTIDSSDALNSVEKAQLSLGQAQRSYEDAVNAQYVCTDIGGTVLSIQVSPGDTVTAGQEVATVRDSSALLLTLSFPAAEAAGFSVGQSAQVTLDGTYETLTGTVRSISGEDTLSGGSLLVRSVVIAVQNAGSLTTAQAATASVGGVSALDSARFEYQRSQTITASASGRVAALCVQQGSTVSVGDAILQLTSDSLTRQLETASDELRSAELSVSDAENALEDYTITAPISGTIIQKNIQAGETIGTDSSSSETLCLIHDLSYLELTLDVDELEILSIQVGQTATITADALSDETFEGVVTNVSSAGTTTGGTTTYPVTIRIDDYGSLMPGMNATAEIVVDSAENALAIPNAAVVRGDYVLVTEDSPSAQNAEPDVSAPEGYVYVKVDTGVSDNDYIEILSGLQEGDTIAYDPAAASVSSSTLSGMMGGMGGMGGDPAGGMGGGPR